MSGPSLKELLRDEDSRRRNFPVTAHRVFMAHAAVSPLPRAAVDALSAYADQGSRDQQEGGFVPGALEDARVAASRLLGCRRAEIALLGPTSLGLNLVADGLPWREGDEILFYGDDYPANVYPWSKLAARGVVPVRLRPGKPGVITWDLVEEALTERTRLVALATCHFLSGWRVDVEEIGVNLGRRGVLFCLDGIQTLGAFPLSVEHVDFLSADSHKWLLGPLGAGIFYVRESMQEILRPTLLGSWNVRSPDFVAQERIEFCEGARRYEPGALNVPGILAMRASMRLLIDAGIETVAERILELRNAILEGALALGYRHILGEGHDAPVSAAGASGIITLSHPGRIAEDVVNRAAAEGVSLSLRRDRQGRGWVRVAPHFYNTGEEVERLLSTLSLA